jgi:hypothetical protein
VDHGTIEKLGVAYVAVILLAAIPLLCLLACGVERARKWLGWCGYLIFFGKLVGLPLSTYLFFGTHLDWSGLLVAEDGLHFADGCPIDGLTVTLRRSGSLFRFNVGCVVAIVTMFAVAIRHEMRNADRGQGTG